MRKRNFWSIFVAFALCLIAFFLTVISLESVRVLEALPFLAIALLFAAVVSSALADGIAKRASKRIREVSDSVKSLNAGQYAPLNADSGDMEFYALFNEINALNENTNEYIRARERERRKLYAVLENVAQGLVALDEKGRIAFANGSALRLFGGNDKAVGNALVFLIADTALCEKIVKGAADGDFSFSYAYAGKDLIVTGKAIEGDGNMARLLVFTDVTSEREIARQKSDFFANASHELKTPVTVTRGLAELLLAEEGLTERGRRQVERIYKENLRLSELISDMLKLSRLERATVEDERTETDLGAIAREALAELGEEAKAKKLTVEVEETGDCRIHADPKKAYELLQNLCSNAVHYNKEGGRLRVELSGGEGEVSLVVADSGIGIEKEHLPRLCERFYRVDKSRSKTTGGTGLGLAIVKHICALYGAELNIESEFGEGTRVTVRIPR